MLPELGRLALVLALCVAAVQGVAPLLGAHRNIPAWMGAAGRLALAQFILLLLALVCLGHAFIENDFSVRYVAAHSNRALPMPYRVAAVWGGHEGSLLLWAFILALWGVAVARFSRGLPEPFVARVLAVMALVATGFLSFLLFTSNPFERLLPAALEGADLNPLLQDPGLVLHPPLLYMGYVGFSVAFSFAIAALLEGRLDSVWARWARPWTLAAWSFLTLGIGLGSWWAYYELGWGGWWFWDPVENASFMPWLVGTALIHSLAVSEKRGAFKAWTVLLAICAFALSLLGTFLVRSGVLNSVHAFANDPGRGVFVLAFLAVVVGASFALFAWRAPGLRSGTGFQACSRETLLLTGNVLLVAAAGSVLLGTIYPLVLDALGLGKVSVGPPYFDAVFVPLIAPLLFLAAVGPLALWKHSPLPELALRLRWALAAAALGAALAVFVGRASFTAALGILLSFWLGAGLLLDVRARARRRGRFSAAALFRLPAGAYGMWLGDAGLVLFTLAVAFSGAYSSERDVRIGSGEEVVLGGYGFRLTGVDALRGPNYRPGGRVSR